MRHIDTRSGEVALALVAALLALMLLALGYSRAWPLAIDIGGHDSRFVDLATKDDPFHGFHAAEPFGGTTARWTTGDATIALPRPPDGVASILTLRMLNSRPHDQPIPLLRLSADGRPLGAFDVTHPASGMRVYRLLVPSGTRLDWAIRFSLRSDPITLPDDPRPLGVVAAQVMLTPLGSTLLPATWLLLMGALIGALGYTLPRSAALGRGTALAISVVLAALIGWSIASRPLEVLPFVQRIAALLGIGCLGIWIARLLAPPVVTTDERRPTTIPPLHPPASGGMGGRSSASGRWSVRGADLPIYLAVVWWMGPLFQVVMTADGAKGVSPPPATAWIGGILALLLAGLGGWRLLRGQALPADQRASRITRWSLTILAAAAVAHLGYMLWFAFQRQGPDFWILFKGARDWARGGSLYDLDAIATNHFGHVFKVPPFYGMLFVPFVFQDGERILLFHRMLNMLLIGATALIWFRMWRLRLLSSAGAGVLVLLNFRPLADTLAFGQIDLALLVILALALWALQNERDLPAGGLVALGTLFKIYPLLLLAFFVIKRRWWALAGFALGMLAFNAVAVAVMGWEMHRIYMTEVLPRIGGTSAWVENQTISGFMARFVAPPTDAVIFRERSITLVATALSGAVALLACVLALGAARPKTTTYALQYSQFLLLMVLVIPAAWVHYETLLFVPFAVLLLHLRDRDLSLPRVAALALSFALIAYGNQLSFYTGTVMGILTIAGVSYKFYGMLLLGGVLAGALLEERAPLELPRWLPLAAWQRQAPRARS